MPRNKRKMNRFVIIKKKNMFLEIKFSVNFINLFEIFCIHSNLHTTSINTPLITYHKYKYANELRIKITSLLNIKIF